MKLQDSRVLLTGGAGFIGSHVADALVAAGVSRLVVVDDLSLGQLANLEAARRAFPALEFHPLDLADEAAVERLLGAEQFDFCFNLAVIPLPASLIEPKRTTDRNVLMTTNVCELARAGKIRRLIQYSSSEVYGTARSVPMGEAHPLEAETPYAASKVATDSIALSYHRTFGIDAVVLRPFNNYGPRQNDKAYAGIIPIVANRVKAGAPISIHGDGEQTRDFIYVGDTARATLMLAERDDVVGEVFNVGSGKETSVNALVGLMVELMGQPEYPLEYGPARPGDVRRHLAGVAKAEQALGFAPEVSLREGMAETLAWYRSRA
ncbi:MAG: GDP-mannose 4,6-dehydratase [Pseudomonadota bacterium]|nr:GDP-mannose 4,6-dehydratase [Pseudomonadota bacterium]MDP1903391.1 GDP-mannose 4,6-dehydratase [Pseudomonadota bacterium]MDP2352361.1 GDP-mannose 4,6-dehydratase [Pseudomonadota bacterium]